MLSYRARHAFRLVLVAIIVAAGLYAPVGVTQPAVHVTLVADWTATAPLGWSWSGKAKPRPTGVVDEQSPFEPGVIQVKVAKGVDITSILRSHSLGGSITHWNAPPFSSYDIKGGLDRWYRVALPVGTEKAAVTLLASYTKEFDYVGLAWVSARHMAFDPNDPMYVAGYQGNLTAMHLPRAWDRTTSSSAVVIAFIDSGLRGTHEDFLGKQVTGCDFSLGQTPCTPIAPNALSDGCGHGSETTSLGAGGTNNGVGMASTGFNSSIMAVKLIRDDCNISSTVSKADPIRYAYNNGAHVINMSYGGTVYDGPNKMPSPRRGRSSA